MGYPPRAEKRVARIASNARAYGNRIGNLPVDRERPTGCYGLSSGSGSPSRPGNTLPSWLRVVAVALSRSAGHVKVILF